MELLVYARNYRPLGADADTLAHCDLGAVVGEPAPPFCWGERLCSFIEVRLPMTVVDLGTEIELLVAKAFAVWGRPGGGRVLRFTSVRGQVALLLEPGFEQTRDLYRTLRPVLPRARVLLDRAVAQAAQRRVVAAREVRAYRSGAVAAERAVLRPGAYRFEPPRLPLLPR
ncbi:MAG: hypothetical protein AAGF11_41880 [Myxococcota bacterium]